MQTLYQTPTYYEIAFSFRDILKETDVLEESIRRYSHIPVKRVLEVGCGPGPHLEELAQRGYEYTGIDLSEEMLEYTRLKAKRPGVQVELICADMVNFQLGKQVDFGYIMLGSLYIKSTDDMISHFDSMGRVMRRGGLYLLDWCVEFDPLSDKNSSWTIEQHGIQVNTTYSTRVINRIDQTFEETITLQIDDHGQQKEIQEKCIRRAIYPQEFLMFISGRDDFEFIGWWNNWDLSCPLKGTEQISRPIILLRRT